MAPTRELIEQLRREDIEQARAMTFEQKFLAQNQLDVNTRSKKHVPPLEIATFDIPHQLAQPHLSS